MKFNSLAFFLFLSNTFCYQLFSLLCLPIWVLSFSKQTQKETVCSWKERCIQCGPAFASLVPPHLACLTCLSSLALPHLPCLFMCFVGLWPKGRDPIKTFSCFIKSISVIKSVSTLTRRKDSGISTLPCWDCGGLDWIVVCEWCDLFLPPSSAYRCYNIKGLTIHLIFWSIFLSRDIIIILIV